MMNNGIAPEEPQQPSSFMQQEDYDDTVAQGIEAHLNKLPENQQAFLTHFLSPELTTILGMLLGKEAFDYFAPYTDPNKMLVVQPRPKEHFQQDSASVTPQQPTQKPTPSIMGM